MSTSIKHLRCDDVPMCLDGGRSFFDEGKLGTFVPESFVRHWRRMIEDGIGVIIGSFDGESITGALGAVLAPDLNSEKTVAVECFWYVIPGHRGNGLRLLKEFESWAKRHGAGRLAMIHLLNLQPERIGELYKRLGYHPVEVNYIKDV